MLKCSARSTVSGKTVSVGISNCGGLVSGGQARRIALARAFLKDAPVLLLDEPTEGLDEDTENEFLDALDAWLDEDPRRSVLIVTHRAKLLERAREAVATCAISGAVGTFANVDPSVEAHVAEQLGLTPEPVSSQVIPRDRHANYFAALGLVASSIENLAVEVRHLQRSEVREAEEFFSKGQKGSSAMPHKRNPILTENLTGLARLVRSAVVPAMENVALWHERDISHSSVERGIGPDATVHLDFALHRAAGVVEGLVVHGERMKANLDAQGGLHNSQRVLLALTQKGVSREAAYRLVQRNGMKTWDEGGMLVDHLKADEGVTALLSNEQIEACFDEAYHLKHVDTIFRRVFGEA